MAFPSNPTDQQEFVAGAKTFRYNATTGRWRVFKAQPTGSTAITQTDLDTAVNNAVSQIDLTSVSADILPEASEVTDLGSPTKRFKDLYLSENSIYLGDTTFSSSDVLPFNLEVAPEVLDIQVAAPAAGGGHSWLWTWEVSALPYARIQITNQSQLSVPLYKQGTYVINNFSANELLGDQTQIHKLYLKWIAGPGTDNLVDWVTYTESVTSTHPDINDGNPTDVQRLSISVPENIVLPTLTPPTVSYTVSNDGSGSYTFAGDAFGSNVTLGPVYRGGTYTFNVSATGHPLYLTTDNGTNFSSGTYFGEYTNGVTGSRTENGTLTFTVPADAPDTLYYQCGNHSSMRGVITVSDLEVETNNNGNYVLYFQHSQQGHKTPVEIRPVPGLISQMCLVYDQVSGEFVLQDLSTYVENTPSFKNKIQEVAGTATLIAPDGVPVVATVSIYSDATYLPLAGNNIGDLAFDSTAQIMYVWSGTAWNSVSGTTDGITVDDLNSALTSYATTSELSNYATTSDLSNYATTAQLSASVPTSINDLSDVNISSPTAGQALIYDGTRFTPGDVASGGGGGAQEKTYTFVGPLQENTSVERLYVGQASTLTNIRVNLGTSGNTSSEIKVKKNGNVINTITIPANTLTVNVSTNVALAAGDYFSVDITKSSSATNLYVTLIYGAE